MWNSRNTVGPPIRGTRSVSSSTSAPEENDRIGVCEPSPQIASPAAEGCPKRILLVDDHPDGADALAVLIRQWGLCAQVAHSARAALIELPHFKADAVVLDIDMPDMNGFELAIVIRSQPATAHLPMIALTGRQDATSRRTALAAGIRLFLVKPVDATLLRTALEALTRAEPD